MIRPVPARFLTTGTCVCVLILFCLPWVNTMPPRFAFVRIGGPPATEITDWHLVSQLLYPDWTSGKVMLRQSGLQMALGEVSCNSRGPYMHTSSGTLEVSGPYRVSGITPCPTMQLYPVVVLFAVLMTVVLPMSTRRYFIVVVLLVSALDLVILQYYLGFPVTRAKHDYASVSETHYYGWFWLAQAALVCAMIVEYRAMRKVARLTEASVDAR